MEMDELINKIKQYIIWKAEIEKIESQLEPLRQDLLLELQKRNVSRLEIDPFYIEQRQMNQERLSKKDVPESIWKQYSKPVTIRQLIVSTKNQKRRSRSRSPTRKST